MSLDGHGTQRRRKIAENSNRLSRVHERNIQTDRRQTDGRRHIANVNVSACSLKMHGRSADRRRYQNPDDEGRHETLDPTTILRKPRAQT